VTAGILSAAVPLRMRSVVLASFQGEQFIGEQLDSILSQLAPEDEVIISDDASTDRTLEVVAQRCDPRIRLVANTERVGYVQNFQRAIDHSRGDYIYFSDQDDVWLPNKIAMLDAALRNNPFVASDAVVVNARLEQLQPSYFGLRRANSFTVRAIFFRPRIIGATMACERRYLATLLPIPAGVPHDFWLSINAALDGVLGIVAAPLILYRRHSSAASPTATNRSRTLTAIASERWRILRSVLRRRGSRAVKWHSRSSR
jgi:glycosyltransferase involved in cell wall biosynthesis